MFVAFCDDGQREWFTCHDQYIWLDWGLVTVRCRYIIYPFKTIKCYTSLVLHSIKYYKNFICVSFFYPYDYKNNLEGIYSNINILFYICHCHHHRKPTVNYASFLYLSITQVMERGMTRNEPWGFDDDDTIFTFIVFTSPYVCIGKRRHSIF